MARIVPGVQVTVVKDVVPQQLTPSGVLGLVGVTEKKPEGVERVSSWSRLVELFGPGTAYSMPEARQALDNGVYQLVISPVDGSKPATLSDTKLPFTLKARAGGNWANKLKARVTLRRDTNNRPLNFDLELQRPSSKEWESHRYLTMVPGPQYFVDVLAAASGIATVSSSTTFVPSKVTLSGGASQVLLTVGTSDLLSITSRTPEGAHLVVEAVADATVGDSLTISRKAQGATNPEVLLSLSGLWFPGSETQLYQALIKLRDSKPKDARDLDVNVSADTWPLDGDQYAFKDGADADSTAYLKALARLENEADVDLVLAAVQDIGNASLVEAVYLGVISHCQRMATDCKGRIGFGQVPTGSDVSSWVTRGRTLMSERFVLVAPHGMVGSVAGMVGSLAYNQSPTFKRVAGVGRPDPLLGLEDQSTLVAGHVAAVAFEPNQGTVVLRGLTTDGEQINVRRIADHAVRGVKMIGDLFIGTLNTETGRTALRQKLAEFLLQMEKDTAIVRSTDGADPAFKVNVYSSQADFAQGIVRVDLAIRPVRAIDYIYATIQIQA